MFLATCLHGPDGLLTAGGVIAEPGGCAVAAGELRTVDHLITQSTAIMTSYR